MMGEAEIGGLVPFEPGDGPDADRRHERVVPERLSAAGFERWTSTTGQEMLDGITDRHRRV